MIGERAARDPDTGKTHYISADMKYEDWKAKFVDKMAANEFRVERQNYATTFYNPKADYSINISELSNEVNEGLSEACRIVARKGSDNECEALSLIDLSSGKEVYFELGGKDYIGERNFWEYIKSHPNGRYGFVHSHPTDSFCPLLTWKRLPDTIKYRSWFQLATMD